MQELWLRMVISPRIRKVLKAIESTCDAETRFTIQELVWARVAELKVQRDDPLRIDEQLRAGLYKNCSDEQWMLYRIRLPEIAENDVRAYRRLTLNSPLEYARHLSLAARCEWISAKVNWKYNRDELWRPLLASVAAHDSLAMARLIELWNSRFADSGHLTYEAITRGVIALVQADQGSFQEAVEAIPQRKCPPYVGGICGVLRSIQSHDAGAMNEGFDQLLSKFKSYMYGDASYSLIDPFALGLRELLRPFSPDLAAQFREDRDLPWDQQFASWRETSPDVGDEYRQMSLPTFLQGPLTEMVDMDWPPDNRPRSQ